MTQCSTGLVMLDSGDIIYCTRDSGHGGDHSGVVTWEAGQ